MTTVTQADRDAAAQIFRHFGKETEALNASLGNMDDLSTVALVASIREAAFEAGAKAMHVELATAAKANMDEYKRGHANGLREAERLLRERADACSLLGDRRHILSAAADAIAALDPAQIAGGEK